MLRYEVLAVHDHPMHLVAKLVLQCVKDDLERAAPVVAGKVFHVLQQERGGTLGGDDTGHVKEQGALRLIAESGFTAETALLGHAGQTERLARETGEHHVTVRDVVRVHLCDVAGHGLREPVIRAIGARRELVPLAGEHGMTAGRREAAADAADAGEQVDGAEVRAVLVRGTVIQLLQRRHGYGLGLDLAGLPPLHGRGGQPQ